MPTFVKTGYWESAVKSYKGWLNLEELITNTVPPQSSIYTENGSLTSNRTVTMGVYTLSFDGGIFIKHSAQSYKISTFYGAGTNGNNIWIGNGGLNSSYISSASDGSYNTSIGVNSLLSNTSGRYNTSIGYNNLTNNTIAYQNTVIGCFNLIANTSGNNNIAVGTSVLRNNSTGNGNVSVGGFSLYNNTTGQYNSAYGPNSLYSNNVGENNSAFGLQSLNWNTSGSNNTSIGAYSGYGTGPTFANRTGSNNIFIGYQSVGVSQNESNRTWIGNSSTTSTWLGGNLLLGTTTDSGLYKLDVTGKARTTSLNLSALPTSSVGLSAGDVWSDGGILKIV